MSTFRIAEYKCGLCGHSFEVRKRITTSLVLNFALDFRASGMIRRTMNTWVYKCPGCGYTHARIRDDGKRHKAYTETEEYKNCEGAEFTNSLAADFYRYALILLRDNETVDAYEAFLHAAWVCDDSGDTVGAMICRNRSIGLYDESLFGGSVGRRVRHVDLLRRTGRFEEALKLCNEIDDDTELIRQMLELQVFLINSGKTEEYLISDTHKA